jgi:hypothetical protein
MTNPGFETGDTSGWEAEYDVGLMAVPEQGRGASFAGLVYDRSEQWHGVYQLLYGKLADHKTYRVCAWVRLQNAASDTVQLRYVDGMATNNQVVASATVYDSGWTFLDGTLVLTGEYPVTSPYIYIEGPAPGVNFYVDDVYVTEVRGDLDDNAAVDLIDFNIFARYYGIDCAVEDCGPANIEDCDSIVNEIDLALFVADWLTGT